MTNQQPTEHKAIELLFAELTKQGTVESFEKTIQQNIDTKRLSAQNQTDFYDRLMLNIAYFVENKKAWEQLLRTVLQEGASITRMMVEGKVLQEQMVIRESIATQMDDYKEIFHKQYESLDVTDEAVVYDYAYASVEHSLRFDFLSYLLAQPNWTKYIYTDIDEMIRLIDGYVSYYADQFVNQMELK